MEQTARAIGAPSFPGLEGRSAVVTGGSGAIGAEVCRALARHGARVVVSGRRKDALDRVVGEILAAGGTAIGVVADMTDERAVSDLRAEAESRIGPVDLVAAIAGGGGEPVPIAELDVARFRRTVDDNLTSVFLTIKELMPGMMRRGRGSIVTMSSTSGELVVPHAKRVASSAYAAAKAGMLILTRQAAREAAPSRVRVNAVSPASVRNERIDLAPPQVLEEIARAHPLGRIGEPADIASAVLFLLSDASSWITGATLDVNGGLLMH